MSWVRQYTPVWPSAKLVDWSRPSFVVCSMSSDFMRKPKEKGIGASGEKRSKRRCTSRTCTIGFKLAVSLLFRLAIKPRRLGLAFSWSIALSSLVRSLRMRASFTRRTSSIDQSARSLGTSNTESPSTSKVHSPADRSPHGMSM